MVRTIGIMCAPYAGITRVRFDGYVLRLGRADRTTPDSVLDHSAAWSACKRASKRKRAAEAALPGGWTATNRVLSSGVKHGPQSSAPRGVRRKCLVSARPAPTVSVPHTPSAIPAAPGAPSVAIHKRPRLSNAQLSGHDSQPFSVTSAWYDEPSRAQFTDFEPFYEFVSGPIHAGGFGPNELDDTFGPRVVFTKHPPAGMVNAPPTLGGLYFGHVRIDGKSGVMTVNHRDLAGAVLHSVDLSPAS
jgi:hypothetical protein